MENRKLMYERFSTTGFTSYKDYCKNFKITPPAGFNFAYDVMDVLAAEQGDHTAMVWTNLEGDVVEISFAEMKRLTDKTANFLTSLGIKKGDAVMCLLKRHYEYWVTALALHKMGAILISASHQLTKKDIEYRCEAAKVVAIVATAQDDIAHQVEIAEGACPTLRTKVLVKGEREGWQSYEQGVAAASEEWTRVPNDTEDTMLIFFTSGTTGMPKIVTHNFRYPLGHISTAVYWNNVKKDKLHLSVSDSGWAKCAWGKFYGQWLGETAIFVYDFDRFIPADLLKILEKFKIVTFCAPPTVLRYLIKEDLSSYDLSAMEYVTTAGEALNPEVFDRFKEATGLEINEGFGQSETVICIGNFVWMEPKVGSLGKPNPVYNIKILDPDNVECPVGEAGEICILTGDAIPTGLFTSYDMSKESTEKQWKDGIYRTGDVAWKDEKGYFWYVGRADDVIKSSGYRIGPFEVESSLMEHPAVLETAVIGVPDPVRGHLVKAFIVLAKGYEPSTALIKELQDHVKNTTAPYKYPRAITFIDALPKTVSGKIKRVDLRKMDDQGKG